MPVDPEARYEVRRLVGWFDDKFHHEVTVKLLYERVNKKVMGSGYPDSRNVKDGAQGDQVSPRLHGLAAGSPALAGWGRDDAWPISPPPRT